MDLSKLPKLSDSKSQTSEQTPNAPLPVQSAAADPSQYRQPSSIGGDIWFSAVIGLLLLYLGGTFGRYAIAAITHQPFHTGVNWTDGPKSGTEVAYFELEGFTAWSDMGIFLFGLVVLFEATAKAFIAIKPGNVSRFVLMLAIALTFVGIGLNIVACLKMFSVQITPLMSGLAVAFGGWILFDEWATLQRMKPARG